jgi:hypothetical protein
MKAIPAPERSRFIVGMMLAVGLGLPSVLLYALPIGQRQIGLLLLAALLFYFGQMRRSIPTTLVWLVGLGGVLSSLTAVYWGNPAILAYAGYFVMSALLVGMATRAEIEQAVDVATNILLVLVVFAWVSLAYAFRGGGPTFEISGYPGQPVSLYLTSMALSIHGQADGNLIRPSGIFDEPGALAFFVSACAAVRLLLRMPTAKTWWLLFAGVVTTSLALLIFIVVVAGTAFTGRQRLRIRMSSLLIGAGVSVAVVAVAARSFSEEIKIVSSVLTDRLQAGDDGRLVQGDSRTAQFLDGLRQITPKVALFGTDGSCFADLEKCYSLDIQGGGSPLHPMLMRGLLSQSPYYIILAVFLFRSLLGPDRLVHLGVALMFMQRPYIMTMGYSAWALMVLLLPRKPPSPSAAL